MKFLKKFEKFEENTNRVLSRLLTTLWIKLVGIVPAFVFVFYHKFKSKIITFSISAFHSTKNFTLKVIDFLNLYKKKLFDLIDKIQSFPLKSKIFALGALINTLLLKTPLKNHVSNISSFVRKWIEKFFNFLERHNNPQTYIATIAMLMISFGTFNIYDSTNKIYMQEFSTRTPASVQEYVDKPEYEKYEKRTVKVFNVKVPIFQESISSIRSVTIDFSVRTDTRFAKQYLEEFEYKLKDYFFLTVEPVISDFPLQEEGKSILKDKILRELNNFLKHHKIEGKVVEVKLIYIIAS